jgi:uncharacterized protein DUF3617
MRLRTIVLVAAAAAVSATVFAQARRDGKWEVTMEMDMPGMPMKIPPMTHTQCVTKQQAEANDVQKMFPQGRGGRGGDQNCTYTDQKIEGNKVSWKMACTGPQPMTGSGEMTFADNAYTGVITMDMAGRGSMNMKYTGKRVGDCDQ